MSAARAPNLFRRLHRFAPSLDRDPQEDRLTEALAATFEGAPEAARFLVSEWFELVAEGDLTVATQKRVTGTERLDLELRFGALNRPAVTVWLEAKVGSTPHREQVSRYLEVLASVSGETRLSWLLPVGGRVEGGSPIGVLERSWQDLAVTLSRWRGQLNDGEFHTHAARLIEQFVTYLEEEGHAVTQPLSAEDVAAVEAYPMAEKRITEILRLAAREIHSRRAPLKRGSRPPAAWGFYEHVAHDERWRPEAFFEWRATDDKLRHDPAGSFVFAAGVSWERANSPAELTHPSWFNRRFEEGFEYGVSKRNQAYLLRYRPFADLVATTRERPHPQLAEQADLLAKWALESWDLLDADPLP